MGQKLASLLSVATSSSRRRDSPQEYDDLDRSTAVSSLGLANWLAMRMAMDGWRPLAVAGWPIGWSL